MLKRHLEGLPISSDRFARSIMTLGMHGEG